MRNFKSIQELFHGANYVIQEGQPYRFKIKVAGWNNADRIIAASRVINGEDIRRVAREINCCTRSIRNWIKTLYTNNPRLDG